MRIPGGLAPSPTASLRHDAEVLLRPRKGAAPVPVCISRYRAYLSSCETSALSQLSRGIETLLLCALLEGNAWLQRCSWTDTRPCEIPSLGPLIALQPSRFPCFAAPPVFHRELNSSARRY